jgi:hypothetical protein
MVPFPTILRKKVINFAGTWFYKSRFKIIALIWQIIGGLVQFGISKQDSETWHTTPGWSSHQEIKTSHVSPGSNEP